MNYISGAFNQTLRVHGQHWENGQAGWDYFTALKEAQETFWRRMSSVGPGKEPNGISSS